MSVCSNCKALDKLEENKRACANCQKETVVYGIICHICSEKNGECFVCRDKIEKTRDVEKYINYTVYWSRIYTLDYIFDWCDCDLLGMRSWVCFVDYITDYEDKVDVNFC
jgi:hypothetical protein